MPRLNLERDAPQLSKAQLDYMKLIEGQVSSPTSGSTDDGDTLHSIII